MSEWIRFSTEVVRPSRRDVGGAVTAAPQDSQPTLHLCGIHHSTSPVAIRERYALAPDQVGAWMRRLREETGAQVLIVSTCNRMEIYAWGSGALGNELRAAMRRIGLAAGCAEAPELIERSGEEALRHLFRVVAGLDSMILGENQIKQQVREATEMSRAAGCLGSELNQAVEAAFRCGKRIRTETELNVGTLDVGKAAILKAEERLGGLTGRACMVIGAGKIGRTAARAIAERRPDRLWIVNRSLEHARAIAEELGGEAYGLEALGCLLPEAEFILGAAHTPELLFDAEDYEVAAPTGSRPERVCLVDVAVPRMLDPRLGELAGVELYGLEDMEEITAVNRRQREAAAEAAGAIVEEELRQWRRERAGGALGPAIEELKARLETIFAEEEAALAEALGEAPADRLTPALRKLRGRTLHAAIESLKRAAGGDC